MLCWSANKLQQNSNASSSEEIIIKAKPMIDGVQ